MKTALSLCAVVLLATGCTMRYTKPNFTEEQFKKDQYECRVATGAYSHNPFMLRDMLDQCMRQKGYVRE
jgi:hypothetical protein